MLSILSQLEARAACPEDCQGGQHARQRQHSVYQPGTRGGILLRLLSPPPPEYGNAAEMIRLALLVDSPSRRAHGNAAARLALGLAEVGEFEPTLVCYGDDPAPLWLPPNVRIHRLGTGRVTRSLPAIVRYVRTTHPDVLITRQVHANFVGLAAAYLARMPPRWHAKLVLVQDHPVDLSHPSNCLDNNFLPHLSLRLAPRPPS